MIAFRVDGLPAPKGSMRVFARGGRAFATHDNERTRPWSASVAWSAKQVAPAEPLDGPLSLTCRFTLPKPKSRKKSDQYPDKKPDLDKLVRAVGDALKGILYTEDSRIVRIVATKDWGSPGVEIEVGPVV